MILKITESCSMNCIHCINDCKSDDRHMDITTLRQSLKFINSHLLYENCNFNTIVLSGGEPFEHPNFKDYLQELITTISSVTRVIVATNGLWICKHIDEFKKIYEMCTYKNSKKFILWQITTDKRYYPVSIDEEYPEVVKELESMSNVYIIRKVLNIYPQGRAETNSLNWNSNAPNCFNARSIASSAKTFMEVLRVLTMYNKFCCPVIEYNGDLKLGESALCQAVSTIWKSDTEIMRDIRDMKCMKCEKSILRLPKEALKILK